MHISIAPHNLLPADGTLTEILLAVDADWSEHQLDVIELSLAYTLQKHLSFSSLYASEISTSRIAS